MTTNPTTIATTSQTTPPDPFVKARAEWEADRAKMHPAAGTASTVLSKIEAPALATVADVKAELVALDARYHAAIARLEDLTVSGVTNPLFAAAKNVISKITSLAKSL